MFLHRMSKAGSTKALQDKATDNKDFLPGAGRSSSRSTSKCSKITLRRSRFWRTSRAGREGSTWLVWEGWSWLWSWTGVSIVTCRKQREEKMLREQWRMLSAQMNRWRVGSVLFHVTQYVPSQLMSMAKPQIAFATRRPGEAVPWGLANAGEAGEWRNLNFYRFATMWNPINFFFSDYSHFFGFGSA